MKFRAGERARLLACDDVRCIGCTGRKQESSILEPQMAVRPDNCRRDGRSGCVWLVRHAEKIDPTPPQNPEVVEGDWAEIEREGCEGCRVRVDRTYSDGSWRSTTQRPRGACTGHDYPSLGACCFRAGEYKKIPPPESPVEIEAGPSRPEEDEMTKIYFWIAARTKGSKDEDSADVVKPESVLAVDAKAAELILMAKVAAKSDVDPNKVVTVVRPFE